MPADTQARPVAAPAIEPAPSAPPREPSPGKDRAKPARPPKRADAATASDVPTVAGHPRAARSVARTKGWAGLIGFLLGGYLSLPTNTLADAGLRALAAGAICYVAAWAAAVFAWRALISLEIARHRQGRDAAHPPDTTG